jgi:ABC-type oligopeptide transport system ATPase subunit
MNSNGENDHDEKTGAEKILEMLRQAGVSTENLEEKKHAFWDTQVRTVIEQKQSITQNTFIVLFILWFGKIWVYPQVYFDDGT